VRTGAVRGTGTGPTRNPNLWYVNVAAAGNVCLIDLDGVRLWRPEAEAAQIYRIVDQEIGTSLEVPFVETEAVRALDPERIAIRQDGEYTILGPGAQEQDEQPQTVRVRFVALDPETDYSEPVQLASALHENGCTTQLALLADTLEDLAE
jgi:hypothetical protein